MTHSSRDALGRVDPRALEGARVTAHHAAQPLAAAAYRYVAKKPDDSHSNLLWSSERERFHGRELPGGHRCFVDIVGLGIGIQGADGQDVSRFDLGGRTFEEAFAALGDALAGIGCDDGRGPLVLPTYDLPDSELQRGAAFPDDGPDERAEVARWHARASAMLRGLSEASLGGAEVRCWPHHFDCAAFVALDEDADPESARSVNVGFSPGDGAIAEPYFYVTPWPVPNTTALPPLEGGATWHREGFTAAVLRGTEVVAAGDAERQAAFVREALDGAVAAAFEVLGATPPGAAG
ncbi:MAG: hypothetical protein AAGI22_20610 [Planctomycetota bacterium]